MTKAQELGITEFPYIEYDSNGNKIYVEVEDGFWAKQIFNDKNQITYYERYNGYFENWKYDENGSIFWENSKGETSIKEKNSLGKEIYTLYTDGSYRKSEYDLNGNIIYYEFKSSNKYGSLPKGEYWFKAEYDSDNNRIYFEDKNGIHTKGEYWLRADYNSYNKIYFEDKN